MKQILITFDSSVPYIQVHDSFDDMNENAPLEYYVNGLSPVEIEKGEAVPMGDNTYCLLQIGPKGGIKNVALKYTPLFEVIDPKKAYQDPDLPCYDPDRAGYTNE